MPPCGRQDNFRTEAGRLSVAIYLYQRNFRGNEFKETNRNNEAEQFVEVNLVPRLCTAEFDYKVYVYIWVKKVDFLEQST